MIVFLSIVYFHFLFTQEIIQGFHSFNPYLPDKLFERFPSLLRMDVLPDVEDKGVAKNMLACALSALKANGMSFSWCMYTFWKEIDLSRSFIKYKYLGDGLNAFFITGTV